MHWHCSEAHCRVPLEPCLAALDSPAAVMQALMRDDSDEDVDSDPFQRQREKNLRAESVRAGRACLPATSIHVSVVWVGLGLSAGVKERIDGR